MSSPVLTSARAARSRPAPIRGRIGLTRALLLLLASLHGTPLLAAQALEEQALEEVVVRGSESLAAAVGEVSALAQLDAETLVTVQPVHPDELFRRVPSVWISRGSGQEHLTAIRSPVLTGAGACGAFQFLEDGVPIRPGGFCNVNNLFEVMFDGAAGVEVARGPGAAEYGGNALNGAINVRTAVPSAVRLRFEAGPWDYGRLFAEAGTALADGAVGVQYSGVSTDGWRDATGYDDQRLRLLADFEQGDWRWQARVSATQLQQETGGFVLGYEAYADDELRDDNPNPEAYRDAFALRGTLRASRETASGRLDVTAIGRRSRMVFLQHFLPGQPLERNDGSSLGLRPEYTRVTDWGEWRIGALLEAARIGLYEFQDQVSFPSRPVGLHYDYQVDGQTLALWSGLAWSITDVTELRWNVRLEQQRYDYDNRMLAGATRDDGSACPGGCVYSRPADREDRFTGVGMRLGVTHQLDRQTALFANVARGFRPPQATELYRLQRGQVVADLDIETLDALEAGVRRTGERLELSLIGYVQRKRDEILRDADGFNVTAGRTRSHGAEVSARLRPAAGHELAADVSFGVHRYDFDRVLAAGQSITSGDPVDTAPEWQGSLRWRYRPVTALLGEFEYAFIDDYVLDPSNTARYDGHGVVNLRLRWELSPRLELSARLLNVLDTEYADRADFAFGNYRYFPGEPRRLFASVDWRF